MSLEDRIQNVRKVIDFLLDIDPTAINVQDNEGNMPYHYANEYFSPRGKRYTAVFILPCNRGADASICNKRKETPLHTFLRSRSCEPFDTDAIATLLCHGAEVTDADDNGNAPLHLAASRLHQVRAASFLLQHGANPATRNSKFETSLHRAGGVISVE
ncbi:ankyrin repeat-containing domain protein [Fusarium tricinctum]|jgi:ankyrin repeat protein|uniref:Ankyrin repeat-containing domain protein n=1 Tax=Fusarium tricinctum TaxID=61284 RepID=A0A8K0RK34_9HYPO|nr:ankyrin repeat-containing domain protein [Fusarium tricinctum]